MDSEEKDKAAAENMLALIASQLQDEVSDFLNFLKLIDQRFTQDQFELCRSNFDIYFIYVKDLLYQQLESIVDPTDVQIHLQKSRRDLMTMCFNYVIKLWNVQLGYSSSSSSSSNEDDRITAILRKYTELRNSLTLTEFRSDLLSVINDDDSNLKPSQSYDDEDYFQNNEDNQQDQILNGSSSSISDPISAHSRYRNNGNPTFRRTNTIRKQAFTQEEFTIAPGANSNTASLEPETDHRSATQIISTYLTFSVLTNVLFTRIPILSWLPKYFSPTYFGKFQGDLIGAITCAFMLIPQSLSYALIAELPPIYGMYAAFVPMMTYSFFGTSNECSIGPVAVLSLLTPSALEPFISDTTSPHYAEAAVGLSFVMGLVMIFAFLLGMGFVIENLLSYPVLSGFISASATIICLSQLKHIFRLPLTGNTMPEILSSLFHQITDIHKWSAGLGLLTIFLILYLRTILPKKLPLSLILIIVSTLISFALSFDTTFNIRLVSDLPGGLPAISTPFAYLSPRDMFALIPSAALMGTIAFIEQISVAKKFAIEKGYDITVSQELFALGICNTLGSCFQSYPVTGGLSRASINSQSGSQTPLNNLLCSLVIGLILLFFTWLFHYTPLPVLGGLVIGAAIMLIDVELPGFLWTTNDKTGLIQMGIVYFGTLIFGPETGIVIAIGISLLQVIYRTASPTFSVLGRLPGTLVYKDTERYKSALILEGIIILRFESNLFFANVTFFKEQLLRFEITHPYKTYYIILDASGINSLDSTAVLTIDQICDSLNQEGVILLWASVKLNVVRVMVRSGLWEKIGGAGRVFFTVHDAVEYAGSEMSRRGIVAERMEEKEKRKEKGEKKRGERKGMLGGGEEEEEEGEKGGKGEKREWKKGKERREDERSASTDVILDEEEEEERGGRRFEVV
eukprot:TRINITY_DN1535_c0_g1_i2.p1 TRINITY_DN1535_c0_g1~~TRINITY_DN1535_c0_g1_i2.p1  ORF type:complete len:911 (+),score=232.33 TRINITY_DN1535_c0_g1_i2:254-2986(+)